MSNPKPGPEPAGPQKNISADDATRRGVYSNEALVAHSPEEFTLDFCFFSPVQPTQGQLVARVVLSPVHVRRFLQALETNIRRYEARFGPIPHPRVPTDPGPGGLVQRRIRGCFRNGRAIPLDSETGSMMRMSVFAFDA